MMALIMVIEDEEALALLLKYNLEKEGYSVVVESNGGQALGKVEEQEPSLILLDWMLPEKSGVEILKHDCECSLCSIIHLKGENCH